MSLLLSYILPYISFALMGLGAFFVFTGAMGMLRMPDFFTRIHPAGVAESLGVPLILLGIMLQSGLTLYTGKLFLLLVFLMIAGPTATHVVSKTAVICGLQPKKRIPKK